MRAQSIDHQRKPGRRRAFVAVGIVATVSTVLAGCGSTRKAASSSNPAPAASSHPASSSALSADLRSLYAGTNTAPPSSGPKAVPGKSVWVISCGQVAPGCALASAGAMDAGKALGWKMKLFDGAFDAADAYVTGIQQAVAAKAAGIITISIDCDTIEPALKVAAAAGIETVNAGGFDCNLSTPGQKPKFTASLEDSSRYPNTEAFAEAEGAAEADWLAAATTGHGKIIQFGLSGNLLTAGIQRGFDQQLHAVCPGCSLIQTVTLSEAQVNSPSSVAQVAQSALLKSPTANAVETPHDTFNLEGISQAIVASGRKQTIKAVAGDGTAGGIALVKQAAGLNGEAMYSTPWSGWAASDCLNRLFAHSACVAEGIGLQLGDSAHGLPSAGAVGYKPPVAYVADYERVWSSK